MILLRGKTVITDTIRRNFTKKIMDGRHLNIALLQLKVGSDRTKNLENASNFIKKAKNGGAKLIALPECFNSPYGVEFFAKFAENVPKGPTCDMLSKAAKENSVYLVGGTFPEIENDKFYNTCTVWNPQGELIARYRKMHLFDIDIPGGITFKESEILSAGSTITTFDVEGVKFGLGICYDLRFEELARVYRLKGCEALIYPGAFNMTTGPLHWELLQRGRAVDNQVFVMAVSPARGDKGYIAWGHSQVTDPWGKVLGKASHGEEIVFAKIDFNECDKIRQQIPIGHQRRTDVYGTTLLSDK